MTEKSVFREAWNPELTSQSFPVSCFWCRGFVPHRKWNLTILAHQNTGKENRYRQIFFAILISTLGRFNRANKNKSVIYTLRSSFMQIKLVFIWKVLHEDSFWNRGTRELGNGPLDRKKRLQCQANRPIMPDLWTGFCSIKQLQVLQLPPVWNANPLQGAIFSVNIHQWSLYVHKFTTVWTGHYLMAIMCVTAVTAQFAWWALDVTVELACSWYNLIKK